jgi:hypothetical protein
MGSAVKLNNVVKSSIVVQQVHVQTASLATTATSIPYDDSKPQSNEGVELFTLAIKPTNAANDLYFDIQIPMSTNAIGTENIIALFKDSDADALAVGWQTTANNYSMSPRIKCKLPAGTTSLTTYKLRYANNAGNTSTVNGNQGGRKFGGVSFASMTITEIKT